MSTNDTGAPTRWAELLQYIALTIAIAGLQLVWSVETGFGSPYLLSLGLKKSLVSLVWLAGPLSGLIMQPLVGIFSDKSTSRFGRRRPYIVGAAACSVLSLTVIGWTREIAGGHETLTIWLAVIAFYFLDFAINCLQAGLRALIVDVLPASRQDAGTAWASRMIGIGNVTGYLMGFLDLVHILPFLGSTHMQVLTTLASLVLSLTVAITCYCTHETPLLRAPSNSEDNLQAFKALFTSLRSLPAVIKRIFRIQLLAWIGWFPFLFYSTTYIADLYMAAHDAGSDEAMERGTRAGSLAMFAHAVVSLCSSLVLPLITYSTVTGPPRQSQEPSAAGSASAIGCAMDVLFAVRRRLTVSLPTMWTISLGVFSLAMMLTLVVSSVSIASALLAACGLSWAVAMWIPYSMIGETIRSVSSLPLEQHPDLQMNTAPVRGDYVQVATGDIPLEVMDGTSPEPGSEPTTAPEATELSAGTILGVHNVFIVLPQFITAFASSLIFAAFEHIQGTSSESEGGQHAQQIALVMCLGGLSATGAGYLTWKLRS
ncbi:hypothetical protein LPJ78_003765 [Coemansia sp. RSA 989]|nr:hypothetical protein LPJ68_002508 [Coemansia sp. RSA 1086]KAJ1749662.1 hypothetical protein LPJ79_003520 [Coemansia sp. RSA 1821]KAJ1863836.1 hypothetical protein LPJ78_003765 [Coemansia sp. RSA 989]KAJ2631610.1 hypothetical protein H4R22_001851 [Coemansia sp. RSA 1290]KAJ2649448.1 hypothetical protein IWW40_003120 [Coemansia sp. RSA 1250]KAJ2670786.1 hypothetical protein IWW42_003819 [Coemansia sp. RSA 1085]